MLPQLCRALAIRSWESPKGRNDQSAKRPNTYALIVTGCHRPAGRPWNPPPGTNTEKVVLNGVLRESALRIDRDVGAH
jgi:hypothetical protein